jgi:hypothetical protein
VLNADVLAAIRPPETPLHFHVHLPRTAGSALQSTWTERGGWFMRLPLDDPHGGRDELAAALKEALDARRPLLVGGHYPFRLLRPALQQGDVVYAAVREPVERAVSLYRYAVSMCQRGTIVNYPGDSAVRARWNDDWRDNVTARGLDPDAFTLTEFLDAGFCPDGSYREYFGEEAASEHLGPEMRGNGFVVLQGRAGQRLLGRRPVNRTTSTQWSISETDSALLGSRLEEDLVAFASISEAFAPRRAFRPGLRRRRPA